MIRASEEESGAAANQRDCRQSEKIGSSVEIKTTVEAEEEEEEEEEEKERRGHRRAEERKAGRRR